MNHHPQCWCIRYSGYVSAPSVVSHFQLKPASRGDVTIHTSTAHKTINTASSGTEGSHPRRSGSIMTWRRTRMIVPAIRFRLSSDHVSQVPPSRRIRYMSIPTMKNAEYGPMSSIEIVSWAVRRAEERRVGEE